jgi:hypothetical protein
MCNMLVREAILIALLEKEYNQVKSLILAFEIWKDLKSTYEGDKHAKKVILQNWMCLFQEAKMM